MGQGELLPRPASPQILWVEQSHRARVLAWPGPPSSQLRRQLPPRQTMASKRTYHSWPRMVDNRDRDISRSRLPDLRSLICGKPHLAQGYSCCWAPSLRGPLSLPGGVLEEITSPTNFPGSLSPRRRPGSPVSCAGHLGVQTLLRKWESQKS